MTADTEMVANSALPVTVNWPRESPEAARLSHITQSRPSGTTRSNDIGKSAAVGDEVSRFAVGDEVWYAGSIGRQGTNSQFHVVDEHVVGHKPASLPFAEAAALP